MAPNPHIGSWRVQDRLGEGGMGAVYRVTDPDGAEYAMKLLPTSWTGDRDVADEIVAHARLLHPNICPLFDLGTVSEHDQPPDDYGLGSTFIVMKRAAGSLLEVLPLRNWAAVRGVLLQVLDGLAHAHARSVVHRDLKPSNILVEALDADVPEVQIADFGISVIFDGEVGRETGARLQRATGTPSYISPEQATGSWRELGPWTDIYALGCIAWELVCGRPPFLGTSVVATILQHQQAARPPLVPVFPVPPGLQGWIHQAMAVSRSRRFRRAPDAARALLALGDAPEEEAEAIPPGFEFEETLRWTHTLAPLETTLPRSAMPGAEPHDASESSGLALFDERPPIPRRWDRGGTAFEPPFAPSLLEVRRAPFVGREVERDILWGALRRTRSTDAPEVVIIAGPTGSGRTRLVEWLAERGRELGVAGRVWADFGDEEMGFAGMLRRTFYLWGVDDHDIEPYLRSIVPAAGDDDRLFDEDTATLARLVLRGAIADRGREFPALQRLFERIGNINLPLVCLDDVEGSADALAFVEFIVGQDSPACLVVATLDDRDADAAFLAAIESLVESDRVTRIDLDVLGERDHRQLVSRLLPLEPEALDLVTRKSLGRPGFVHRLLADWLDEGRLVPSAEGYRLAADPPSKT